LIVIFDASSIVGAALKADTTPMRALLLLAREIRLRSAVPFTKRYVKYWAGQSLPMHCRRSDSRTYYNF